MRSDDILSLGFDNANRFQKDEIGQKPCGQTDACSGEKEGFEQIRITETNKANDGTGR